MHDRVGRDQGLTSKTTVAIVAAAAERPYTVPFSGEVSALHAGEVAGAFIKAVSKEREGAQVFDLNDRPRSPSGWRSCARWRRVRSLRSRANLCRSPPICRTSRSARYLRDYGPVPLEEGIEETYAAFRRLLAAGALSPQAVA